MSAIGIRGLLAATLFGGILLGARIEHAGEQPLAFAPEPTWLRATHGEVGRPGGSTVLATRTPAGAFSAPEPGLFQRARLKLCLAYLGASRRDHVDDHDRRRECAERTGVELAVLER